MADRIDLAISIAEAMVSRPDKYPSGELIDTLVRAENSKNDYDFYRKSAALITAGRKAFHHMEAYALLKGVQEAVERFEQMRRPSMSPTFIDSDECRAIAEHLASAKALIADLPVIDPEDF